MQAKLHEPPWVWTFIAPGMTATFSVIFLARALEAAWRVILTGTIASRYPQRCPHSRMEP